MSIKLTEEEAVQMFRAVAFYCDNHAKECGLMTKGEISILERTRLKLRKQILGF